MKRCLFIFFTLFCLMDCVSFDKKSQEDIQTSEKEIDRFYDVNINGCLQKILVQSNDMIHNPILLYLHGGPGSSALIFSHLYSDKLIDLIVKYGGHHRLSIDLDSLKKTSPYYYEGYLELDNKGKSFSQSNVDKNPKAFSSVKSISKIDVPLYFFEGVNDHVIACTPELVVEYCKNVKAPKKEIIWFKNSAHYMNVEEPNKFQDELIKILEENN